MDNRIGLACNPGPPPEREYFVLCSCCGQEVYPDEETFDGMCPECFDEDGKQFTRREIAEALGYEVVRV